MDDYVPPGGTSRRRWWIGGGCAAFVLATVLVVPRLTGDPGATVRSGPAADLPPIPTSVPLPSRIDLPLPPGWLTLVADGELLVAATQDLDHRDLLLAQLARDDAAFAAFPPEAAVFVVGGDRLTAKYLGPPPSAVVVHTPGGVEIVEDAAGAMVGPGPPYGLGPPALLPGGVTARLGDLPQSSSRLAAYLGPRAPEAAVQDAEAMAAAVRIRPIDPALVPPPPPGSRPGFDRGGVPTPVEDLGPVASVEAAGQTYTARAGGDCAVVEQFVGGCRPRPAAPGAVDVVASGRAYGPPPLPPPPGPPPGPVAGFSAPTAGAMIVLARVGPGVSRVSAVLVDGGTAGGVVGDGGWALVATEGRAFLLEASDGDGRVVGRASVV